MTREQIKRELILGEDRTINETADAIMALHEAEIKEIHRNHLHALNAEHTVQDELREERKRYRELLIKTREILSVRSDSISRYLCQEIQEALDDAK